MAFGNNLRLPLSVTGPGKLTVGKLYGGILIYEIWKTTRFSNLEILAKMEQEMMEKIEKEKGDDDDLPDKAKREEAKILKEEEKKQDRGLVEADENDEPLDEYDQFDEDPKFSKSRRDYYYQQR